MMPPLTLTSCPATVFRLTACSRENLWRKSIPALFSLLFLTAILPAAAQRALGPLERFAKECPVVRIVPERLPDLNVPRSGHSIFYTNGELTVAGGHTTGFVPTPTAEYLAEGEWHQMQMVYSHDNGFAARMRTSSPNGSAQPGEVIIGGGHDEPLGVGQTFTMECYRPATHSFEGFGCLDRRRVLANATQLTDGRVIVSGNNYAADAIACFDGTPEVEPLKDVAQGRNNPYILPIGHDDAIIFGGRDVYAKPTDTAWVDRVKGEAFRVPLLEQWRPMYVDQPFSSDACSIGNVFMQPRAETKLAWALPRQRKGRMKSNHTYLLPATDKSGQTGIIMVRDTLFSLLPTACPVPTKSGHGPILYTGHIAVDTTHRRGYLIGVDSLCTRQYVLAIDYARRPAALTLYETDAVEHATVTIPIVTPDGDLILTGGNPGTNYKPLSTVWLYRFGTEAQMASSGLPLWLWLTLGAVVLAVVAYLVLYMLRRRKAPVAKEEDATTEAELLQRICDVIEHDQRYLTQRLRLSDIAVELGVSTGTLTDCISNQRHCTFAQLVAEYRVHHAQRFLTENPDIKLSALAAASGFTSESTFFRSFKAVNLHHSKW